MVDVSYERDEVVVDALGPQCVEDDIVGDGSECVGYVDPGQGFGVTGSAFSKCWLSRKLCSITRRRG
ncbi:hypothetical protein TNCT_358051 [Trichonephila clavata]|uniref:Uncharacterized protein n=1 Tax=Trichonephila clavata TaxID=2740835 RepID=A0A8X6FVH0_TRICU|nr:hypothetical protein TNCT_358051 [Trichonephila clavata]